MMESLQATLEEKVNEEAALTDMIEKEKSFNVDLEKEVNEKNEELASLKQLMEKETSQHLADVCYFVSCILYRSLLIPGVCLDREGNIPVNNIDIY